MKSNGGPGLGSGGAMWSDEVAAILSAGREKFIDGSMDGGDVAPVAPNAPDALSA